MRNPRSVNRQYPSPKALLNYRVIACRVSPGTGEIDASCNKPRNIFPRYFRTINDTFVRSYWFAFIHLRLYLSQHLCVIMSLPSVNNNIDQLICFNSENTKANSRMCYADFLVTFTPIMICLSLDSNLQSLCYGDFGIIIRLNAFLWEN